MQLADVEKFTDGELAGGVINASEADFFPLLENGGEVVRALLIEEIKVINGTSRENAGDFSFDELAWFRLGRLLGDSDALASLDESGDVRFRRMPRDAAHRHEMAFRERDVQDGRGGLRILEKHFVKVTEPIEQNDVRGQSPAHGLVLGHHRSEFGAAHVRKFYATNPVMGIRKQGKAGFFAVSINLQAYRQLLSTACSLV